MQTRRWMMVGVLAVLCTASTAAKSSDAPDPDPGLGAIGVKAKGPTGISAPVHAVVFFYWIVPKSRGFSVVIVEQAAESLPPD